MMKWNEKILVLDTETTNGFDDPFCYDVGWSVIAPDGYVFQLRSFVVADIFLDENLMSNAFFADKVPTYWDEILQGRRQLKTFYEIRKEFLNTLKRYHITKVVAHNARFDYRSLTRTQRFLTSSKYRYFFPRSVEIWDSLKMARLTFGNDPEYVNFCFENGYVTPKTHVTQLTAEVLYRFLTGSSFTESHTGTEDTMIERCIFAESLKRNPEIDGRLWQN